MKHPKVMKCITVIILFMLIILTVSACGEKGSPDGSSTTDTPTQQAGADTNADKNANTPAESALPPMEITLYMFGDKPNQMDEIEAEFERRTKDELNLKINFNFTPFDDYANMIKLKLSAGESVDACFDAQWMNLNTFIMQGNYTDLTEYFQNDKYPGLQKAFDANYLANNMLGTDKIYAIPFTQAYGTPPLVFIRGDLREKYGASVVSNLDSFKQYLTAIVENESQMTPFALAGTADEYLRLYYNENYRLPIDMHNAGVWDGAWDFISLSVDLQISVYVEDYQIKAAALLVEPESALANFPAPYNKRNLAIATLAREFYDNNYIDKDFLNISDARAQFTSGKAGSMMSDTANYQAIVSELMQSVPDAKVEVYQPNPVYKAGIKNMVKGDFAAWNFMAIPVTTPKEKVDRIMLFYNWLYSSTENHDLFEYGIEGKNFIAIGEDQYKIPDGVDIATNYNPPGYQFTWNPNYIRIPVDIPADVVEYTIAGNNHDTYYNGLFSGFNFLGENVETQLVNPDFATVKSKILNIQWGLVPNIAEAFTTLDAEISGNKNLMEDIEILKAEFLKQAQAYLDERKLSDEANNVVYPK